MTCTKSTGRHGTRTSAVIRITSRENLKRPSVGFRLDHCYTYHRALNRTSVVPHCTSVDDEMTLLTDDQPCLALDPRDDVNLTNPSEQDGDCDVHSLTHGDLPDLSSDSSPMMVTSNIKTTVTAVDCEDGEAFLSLLSNNNCLNDALSKDTDKIREVLAQAGSRAEAPKPVESIVKRERVIHICDICGKSFIRRKECVEHHRKHTGERPFHCDICGRGFSRFRSVAVHQRQHTNERPFVCDVCAKQFYTSGELLKHRRNHSGEKPYRCLICGKEFQRCGEYTDHRRVHTGENVCLICGKEFTRLHNMKEHMSSAHAGEKRYTCTTCGKQFAYSSGLRYHRRLHKTERPFKCQECGKCFARMGELNRHRRGTHKIMNLPAVLQK